MVSPYHNVGYSAYYLASNYQKTNNWQDAIAMYHSKNPLHSSKYIRKINKTAKNSSGLLMALNDSNKKVRETSAWCMEKICEKFSIHLTQNKKVFDSIITSIMALIEKSNNKITVHLLCGMHYLAIALQPKDFQTSSKKYLN